jgi:hypothetical protein
MLLQRSLKERRDNHINRKEVVVRDEEVLNYHSLVAEVGLALQLRLPVP